MPEPAVVVGGVMAVSLVAYALLGGADYGGGVWDLMARGESATRQRETIARAIAPVWEANHVWLILVLTVLFTAFPPAFAWISTHLHLPLALALVGIVLRGSAFVFRAYGPPGNRLAHWWSRVFAVSSVVTPALLGVTVGALTEGRMPAGDLAAGWPWLTPFSAAVGVFGLVLCAYLAAVYLTLEADDPEVEELFRRRALGAGVLTGLMALTVFLLAGHAAHIREMLTTWRGALPLHAGTAAAALAALALLWTRRYWWARAAAIVQVSLIVLGWAVAQFPYLVRPHLTIHDSAAPRATLVLLVWVLAAGAVILIPSLVYLFRVFGSPRTRALR